MHPFHTASRFLFNNSLASFQSTLFRKLTNLVLLSVSFVLLLPLVQTMPSALLTAFSSFHGRSLGNNQLTEIPPDLFASLSNLAQLCVPV
jgi:Leucine-rich repeat (LRR) protein